MTREPDRYEAKAKELARRWADPSLTSYAAEAFAAALRAEHRETLERAAREVEAAKSSDRFAATQAILARRIRALASPAAAPAAEPCPEPPPGLVETLEKVHGMGCGNIATHRIPAPPSEPVSPSLLPRVLAVLDAEYRRRGGDDGGGYVGALAAELRRYIAEMEGKT